MTGIGRNVRKIPASLVVFDTPLENEPNIVWLGSAAFTLFWMAFGRRNRLYSVSGVRPTNKNLATIERS